MSPDELADRIGARVPEILVARGETTLVVDRTDLVPTLDYVYDGASYDEYLVTEGTAPVHLP